MAIGHPRQSSSNSRQNGFSGGVGALGIMNNRLAETSVDRQGRQLFVGVTKGCKDKPIRTHFHWGKPSWKKENETLGGLKTEYMTNSSIDSTLTPSSNHLRQLPCQEHGYTNDELEGLESVFWTRMLPHEEFSCHGDIKKKACLEYLYLSLKILMHYTLLHN